MEALFASCSEEFQNLQNSQAQEMSIVEGLKSEVLAINQQLQNLDRRISTLEARPTGVQSVLTDGNPNPVGSPSASAGPAAAG
eukprot:10580440-Alexandrium_andersonii.AAC.1